MLDSIRRSVCTGRFAMIAGLNIACALALVLPIAIPAFERVASAQGLLKAMQGKAELPEPKLASGVTALLESPYLTEAEAASLRVRHGAWDEADLASAPLRAKAALIRGALLDPSLDSPETDPLDRAEALILRGDPAAALRVLDESKSSDSWHARRLRAQALIAQGSEPAAIAIIDAVPPPVLDEATLALTRAQEAVEQARVSLLRLRLGTPTNRTQVAAAYQAILTILGDARTRLDPMSPTAPLVEAELLFAHNAYSEGSQALEGVFTLNPKSARAYRLAGEAAVMGLDRARAEAIAAKLDSLASPFPSIDAAIVRSGIRIRMGDAQGAIDAVAPALAAYPESRELLAANVGALARSFDTQGTSAALAALESRAPNSAEGYLAAGSALSDARQYDESIAYLQEATKRAPAWAEPWVELGLTLTQAGRDSEALDTLAHAVVLDPFNKRADNSLTLMKEIATYASYESTHFIVRCKPGVDEILAAEMLPVLERIHARVTGSAKGGIDHVPIGKTVVELYPNHRWFAVRIVGMPGVHTIAAATGPLIALEAPRLGPGHLVGPYDWARVVQHEFVHTVTLSRTKNRLPHWFTEASAVYLEDAPRDWSTIKLLAQTYEQDALFNLDTINLGFVRPEKPTDRSLAYAQGHWMYEFMIERFGNRAPLELMDRYAAGATEDAAFNDILKTSRDAFLADFKVWAGEQLILWGMKQPQGVPTITSLIESQYGSQGPPNSGPTRDAINSWLETYPAHPDVLKLAIELDLTDRKEVVDESMVPLLERYAAARPFDLMPHRLLAKVYLATRDPARAIPHLEYLDAREQSSTAYAEELSKQYANQTYWSRALSKSERATQISPYDARVREFAATQAIRANDLAIAERHIRALIALEPDQPIHAKRLEAILAKQAKSVVSPTQ